jgi:hypothetical protein
MLTVSGVIMSITPTNAAFAPEAMLSAATRSWRSLPTMVSVEQKMDIGLTITAAITKVELTLMAMEDDDPAQGDWEAVRDRLQEAHEALLTAAL